MREPLKTLVIAPYPVFPAHGGGSIRTLEMARSLAELGCRVTIINIQPFASGDGGNGAPVHRNLEIVSVKYPLRLPYLLMGKPFPYHFIASFHPGYRLAIRKYLSAFDVYQFEHPNFADLLDDIPEEKTVVYNAHNVEYDYVTSECIHPRVKAIVAKRIYNLEKKLIQRCAKVLACSDNDKRRFMELYAVSNDKLEIVPNGIRKIDLTGCAAKRSLDRFPELATFKRRALFAGGDVAHNHAAVRFILDDLGPRLGRDCAFVIKGPCGKRVKEHRSENVFVDPAGGTIDNYAGFCTVALNPVTQGGGTNLKILDYLAHGLPVISTEFGMRGYDDLRRFVTLCDLKDFADELRADREIHVDVAKALESYLWDTGGLLVKNVYSSLSGKV